MPKRQRNGALLGLRRLLDSPLGPSLGLPLGLPLGFLGLLVDLHLLLMGLLQGPLGGLVLLLRMPQDHLLVLPLGLLFLMGLPLLLLGLPLLLLGLSLGLLQGLLQVPPKRRLFQALHRV